MAEGIMKKIFPNKLYVQSAGVLENLPVDGFAIAVCQEIGVDLINHRSRSLEEMEAWGDELTSFELIVAMTPAAQRRVLDWTRFFAFEVEYWPTLDPTGMGMTRDQMLGYFRLTRDQIIQQIEQRFLI